MHTRRAVLVFPGRGVLCIVFAIKTDHASRSCQYVTAGQRRPEIKFRLRSEAVSRFNRNPNGHGKSAPMYRCHFTQNGHIEDSCNLNVLTLDAAIERGQKILGDNLDIDRCDGIEIWLDRALLYKFSA